MKRFEDFNWEFDDEEEEYIPNDNIKGKYLIGKSIRLEYWNSNKSNKWNSTHYDYNNTKITNFKHSSEVKDNVEKHHIFTTIPDDCYVFSLKGHWPWFKYDERLLKYIKSRDI